MWNSIEAASGWTCTTVTSVRPALMYSWKARRRGSPASMKSTSPGTRRRSDSSAPGLSRFVAMKMNGADIGTPSAFEQRDLARAPEFSGRKAIPRRSRLRLPAGRVAAMMNRRAGSVSSAGTEPRRAARPPPGLRDRRGLPAEVGADLHRRRRPVHRVEVQSGRTPIEELTAEHRGMLDSDSAHLVRPVGDGEQLLSELVRHAGTGHRRHALDLTDVGDGHDARQDRRLGAARAHLVHQREVVPRSIKELRQTEVSLSQLGGLVPPVGLARLR